MADLLAVRWSLYLLTTKLYIYFKGGRDILQNVESQNQNAETKVGKDSIKLFLALNFHQLKADHKQT